VKAKATRFFFLGVVRANFEKALLLFYFIYFYRYLYFMFILFHKSIIIII